MPRGALLLVLLLAALAGGGCTPSQARRVPEELGPRRTGPGGELLARGDQLFGRGEFLEAKRAYARAISEDAPLSVYVEACAQVARMESLTDSIEAGEPWLRLAARRATSQEPLGWSRLQQVLGIFERETGSRAEARARFERLYDYCLEHGLYERAIDAAHHVVLVSDGLDAQLAWSQRGIEAAEAGGLHGWLAVLWNNKAASLEDEGRHADALVAYRAAREYHGLAGDERRVLIADWALARSLRRNGLVEEALPLAEDVHLRAAGRFEADPSADSAEWLGYALWELAEHAALGGERPRALELAREARERLVEAGIETWGEPGTSELARLDGRIAVLEAGDA